MTLPDREITHAEQQIVDAVVMLSDKFPGSPTISSGDRLGRVQDPFGHVWLIATGVEDRTPAQIECAQSRGRLGNEELMA
jgi:uncharacterized glyoxalase superfamily protein PhnB